MEDDFCECSFFGLGSEDGHVPTCKLLLYCYWLVKADLKGSLKGDTDVDVGVGTF